MTNDNVAGPGPLSQRVTRLIGRLKTRKGRAREALVLVEGVRAVTTALDAGVDVRLAVTSPRLMELPDAAELVDRLRSMHVDVRFVGDAEIEALSDTETPQGVLLVCAERSVPIDRLEPGRWLVLDAVQDPGNAGTLLRAAAAFGADGVIALDGTVDLWSPKAVRASAGLVFHVPVARAEARAVVGLCAEAGVAIIVADAAGDDVHASDPEAAWALVVGNEGAGVRDLIQAAASRRVSVPMRGPAESLNVGIAGSLLLYALIGDTRLGS
ncbi:MAG: RNA methyltransferase [Gemmatimonadota bacterium]